MAAVKERASRLEFERRRRHSRMLVFSILTASFLVIVGLSFFIPSVTSKSPAADYIRPGATASIFDGSRYLGFILIGILAFALGVAVTILFYRIQVRNKKDQDGSDG